MSTSIFQSFLSGWEAGGAQARERRRDVATQLAGKKYQGGDFAGAESALVGEGMLNEAAAMGDLGERSRQRQSRERIRTAMTAPGSVMERATRGREAAFEAGDMETAFNLDDHLSTMDERQKRQMAEVTEWGGGVQLSLIDRGVPEAQRKAATLEALANSPYDSPDARRRIEAQTDWSDTALKAMAAQNMTIAERLAAGERRERLKVEDSRDQRDFEENRRQFNVGAGLDKRRIDLAERETTGGFDPTNPTGVKVSAEQRGRIALSFGNVISAQNQMAALEAEAAKSSTTPYGQDWGARVLEAVPWDGGSMARMAGGSDYQAYETAARSFEQSILPAFAGSAVTESEAARFVRANQPRMGDSAETLAQKADNRKRIINAAASMIGSRAPFPETGVWAAPEETGSRTVEAGDPRGALALRSPRDARQVQIPNRAISALRAQPTPENIRSFAAHYKISEQTARTLLSNPAQQSSSPPQTTSQPRPFGVPAPSQRPGTL